MHRKDLITEPSLDTFLLKVVSTLTTDLMPGPTDPSPIFLPQQPLSKVKIFNLRKYFTF